MELDLSDSSVATQKRFWKHDFNLDKNDFWLLEFKRTLQPRSSHHAVHVINGSKEVAWRWVRLVRGWAIYLKNLLFKWKENNIKVSMNICKYIKYIYIYIYTCKKKKHPRHFGVYKTDTLSSCDANLVNKHQWTINHLVGGWITHLTTRIVTSPLPYRVDFSENSH